MNLNLAPLVAVVLIVLLAGCPGDDLAEPGQDEVGDGDGDPEVTPDPVDPLFGDPPPDCGVQAHPMAVGVEPPASLGNGLVHDSRLSFSKQIGRRSVENAESPAVAAWSSFMDHSLAMAKVGFRPAQLRTDVSIVPMGPQASRVEIHDQSIYISDDDANYRTEIETYLFADTAAERAATEFGPATRGARPTSIASFVGDREVGRLRVGYSLAWVFDAESTPWLLRVGLSQAQMHDEIAALRAKDFRPISISSRRNQKSEYSGIFVADDMPADRWDVSLGLDASELSAEIGAAWDRELYPYRISAEQGHRGRVDVIWAARATGQAVEIRLELTPSTFRELDAHRRSEGYHLETLDRYERGGFDRYVAVWVRYSPCLRWTKAEFDSEDAGRYAMFHEQAIAAMTFEGTDYEGRVARPSGTLHVFEGSELVLNRAYTFAPAIYPNTEINAPMKLASVSKSITAAAVVMELNRHGFPLEAPFTLAAWIPAAPATMADVTVVDTLRNLGGFRAIGPTMTMPVSQKGSPTSYIDHTIIDASPHGAIPITGDEMFDYATLEGHLDTNDLDSYWDYVRYQESQSNGTMHYSNAGYSMLGEVVHHLSGIPYQEYVLQNLAAPLHLQDRLFADPGHRKYARGPTLAGLRAYLVDKDPMCIQIQKLTVTLLALLASACKQGEDPCPECDDSQSPTDLPSDAMDIPNSESCEQECWPAYEGTPYEVGVCNEGKCGPVWYEKQYESLAFDKENFPPDVTCEEICAEFSTSCVTRGCSGKTGYLCSSTFALGCSLSDEDLFPVDWLGDCDEIVPWLDFDPGSIPELGCCCQIAS